MFGAFCKIIGFFSRLSFYKLFVQLKHDLRNIPVSAGTWKFDESAVRRCRSPDKLTQDF